MIHQKEKNIPVTHENEEPTSVRVNVRGRITAAALAGVAAFGLGYVANEANTTHFHGEQSVVITESNVTQIAEDHVEGADNDIQGTIQKIVEMNPDVFQDGQPFVESEDLGKTIEVPMSVDK